jgi:hypothetical protein
MPVILFIQSVSGDYNLEKRMDSPQQAKKFIERARDSDHGYWVIEKLSVGDLPIEVFVPWNQVYFARIEHVEGFTEEELEGGARG